MGAGLRLAAIAVVSALVVATLVIGAGRIILPAPDVAAPAQPDLVLAAAR